MTQPVAPSRGTATRAEPIAPDRLEYREAAQDFEAIFIRRLLASARASSLAVETPFKGRGLEQFEAMRDEHLAQIVSRNGGFGIAEQIEQQLASLTWHQRS